MRFREPSKEEEAAWASWVASRPPAVREVAERLNPWTLYRLKSGGHRVTVFSFGELDGGGVALTVRVSGQFNCVAFERNVFGISPDDLEECDLPGPGEPVGAILERPEEIDGFIEDFRALGGLRE